MSTLSGKKLLASAVLVAVAAVVVACDNPDADVQQAKAPSMVVINRPPPYVDLIEVRTTIFVKDEPRSFHADLEVYRWDHHKGKWEEVSNKRWGLQDLPPPGTEKEFKHPFSCQPGAYYTHWFIWGYSHDGQYGEARKYWPYAKDSNGNKPPSLAESHHVHKC